MYASSATLGVPDPRTEWSQKQRSITSDWTAVPERWKQNGYQLLHHIPTLMHFQTQVNQETKIVWGAHCFLCRTLTDVRNYQIFRHKMITNTVWLIANFADVNTHLACRRRAECIHWSRMTGADLVAVGGLRHRWTVGRRSYRAAACPTGGISCAEETRLKADRRIDE